MSLSARSLTGEGLLRSGSVRREPTRNPIPSAHESPTVASADLRSPPSKPALIPQRRLESPASFDSVFATSVKDDDVPGAASLIDHLRRQKVSCCTLLVVLLVNNLLLLGGVIALIYFLVPIWSAVSGATGPGNIIYHNSTTVIIEQHYIGNNSSTSSNGSGSNCTVCASAVSLGDLRVSQTRLISDRTDAPMRLESGAALELAPAANADVRVQPSGTGALAVGSLRLRDSTLQSTDTVSGLQLVSASGVTLAPAAGSAVAVQGGLSVAGVLQAAGALSGASLSVSGSVVADSLSGRGTVPVGAIVSLLLDVSGADSLVRLRALGFALCDGTTAASQGIVAPVITAPLPDLNGGRRFLRGAAPGLSGLMQGHAMQGHTHTAAVAGAHTHTLAANGSHVHTEVAFVLRNCDYCGGCSFKVNDCTGMAQVVDTGTVADHTHSAASAGAHTHTLSGPVSDGSNGEPSVASETRPDNMSVVFVMRVK